MRESARSGTFDRCLTAAKTIADYRHRPTGREYRPSRRTFLDRCGQSAHVYGSEGRVTQR
jgi:hypothetical protein